MSLDRESAIELRSENAPEHSSGANEARGFLGTWGLYSLKLKAVPHPKSLLQPPLNALLPDVLQYPLARPILASKVGFGQGRHEQRSLADTA